MEDKVKGRRRNLAALGALIGTAAAMFGPNWLAWTVACVAAIVVLGYWVRHFAISRQDR